MPQATLRINVDGREETLSEYICDWPDRPDPGIHVFTMPGLKIRRGWRSLKPSSASIHFMD